MQVYKDQTNVDDYLVNSIVQPTSDPNAGEVYYRYLSFSLEVHELLLLAVESV